MLMHIAFIFYLLFLLHYGLCTTGRNTEKDCVAIRPIKKVKSRTWPCDKSAVGALCTRQECSCKNNQDYQCTKGSGICWLWSIKPMSWHAASQWCTKYGAALALLNYDNEPERIPQAPSRSLLRYFWIDVRQYQPTPAILSSSTGYSDVNDAKSWDEARKWCNRDRRILSMIPSEKRSDSPSFWTPFKYKQLEHFTWTDGNRCDWHKEYQTEASPFNAKACVVIRLFESGHATKSLPCWIYEVGALCMQSECSVCNDNSNYVCKKMGNKCWLWSKNPMSWYSAKQWCREQKAQLATFRAESDVQTIRQVGLERLVKYMYMWIGLRRHDWLSFSEPDLQPELSWGPDEPRKGGMCVVARIDQGHWKMYTENCTKAHKFQCSNRKAVTEESSSRASLNLLTAERADGHVDGPSHKPSVRTQPRTHSTDSGTNGFLVPVISVVVVLLAMVVFVSATACIKKRLLAMGANDPQQSRNECSSNYIPMQPFEPKLPEVPREVENYDDYRDAVLGLKRSRSLGEASIVSPLPDPDEAVTRGHHKLQRSFSQPATRAASFNYTTYATIEECNRCDQVDLDLEDEMIARILCAVKQELKNTSSDYSYRSLRRSMLGNSLSVCQNQAGATSVINEPATSDDYTCMTKTTDAGNSDEVSYGNLSKDREMSKATDLSDQQKSMKTNMHISDVLLKNVLESDIKISASLDAKAIVALKSIILAELMAEQKGTP